MNGDFLFVKPDVFWVTLSFLLLPIFYTLSTECLNVIDSRWMFSSNLLCYACIEHTNALWYLEPIVCDVIKIDYLLIYWLLVVLCHFRCKAILIANVSLIQYSLGDWIMITRQYRRNRLPGKRPTRGGSKTLLHNPIDGNTYHSQWVKKPMTTQGALGGNSQWHSSLGSTLSPWLEPASLESNVLTLAQRETQISC